MTTTHTCNSRKSRDVYKNDTYTRRHIEEVLNLKLVDTEAIRYADLTVAVDAVNSVGGVIIPQLLRSWRKKHHRTQP